MRPIQFIIVILFALISQAVSATESTKPTLTVYTYNSFTSAWGPGPMPVS